MKSTSPGKKTLPPEEVHFRGVYVTLGMLGIWYLWDNDCEYKSVLGYLSFFMLICFVGSHAREFARVYQLIKQGIAERDALEKVKLRKVAGKQEGRIYNIASKNVRSRIQRKNTKKGQRQRYNKAELRYCKLSENPKEAEIVPVPTSKVANTRPTSLIENPKVEAVVVDAVVKQNYLDAIRCFFQQLGGTNAVEVPFFHTLLNPKEKLKLKVKVKGIINLSKNLNNVFPN